MTPTETTKELQASLRSVRGKAVKQLRAKGILPAVVYGHGQESQAIQLPHSAFMSVFSKSGESTLLTLVMESGTSLPVIIQEVQYEPLRGSVTHVDFHRVNLDEKITTEIKLSFVGISAAVKELSGILVKSLDRIKVECLPADLVGEIEVDLARLKTFEDAITVKDIIVPERMTVLTSLEEMVASVQPQLTEEEFKKLDEKPVEAVEAVEVLKAAKPTDEEATDAKTASK